MSSLLKGDKYQDYLTNQLGEAMFEKACKLFGSSTIAGFYHVLTSSAAYNEVNEKKILRKVKHILLFCQVLHHME